MPTDTPYEPYENDLPRSEPNAAVNPYSASSFSAEPSDDLLPTFEQPLPQPHIGWALLWMILFWIVQFFVSVGVAAVMMLPTFLQSDVTPDEFEAELSLNEISTVMIPAGTFFSVITAVVIALLCYRSRFNARLALRGMAWHHWVASLCAVLPLAVVASEVTNWAGEFLPHANAEVLGDFAHSPWALVFVAACLFPAIGEEIFCRGFLGRGLVARHGLVLGVFLSSLLFGIMHIDPVQSVGAFVLGLGLHFIYLTTRSLLAPMLVHMLNNAFAFWVMRNFEWCPLPGLSPLPDGTAVHTPWSVLLAAGAASAALLGFLYQTRTRWLVRANESSQGREIPWSPGYITAEKPPSDISSRPSNSPPKLWLVGLVILTYAALLGALVIESQAVSFQ